MKWAQPHILLRIFVILTIFMQSLMPAAYALAAETGITKSELVCNPSQSKLSAQTQKQLDTLLDTLLVDDDAIEIPSDHCSNCVIELTTGLSKLWQSTLPILYPTKRNTSFQTILSNTSDARGPPLGTRAPPFSS